MNVTIKWIMNTGICPYRMPVFLYRHVITDGDVTLDGSDATRTSPFINIHVTTSRRSDRPIHYDSSGLEAYQSENVRTFSSW